MLLSTVLKNPVSGDVLKLTITDKDTSEPVVASVTIGEETKDSGIDGVVQFTRAYGDYEATISADGYTTVTEELQFRSNHKNFEIELEAETPVVTTGTVTVTVLDGDDNDAPLEDENVFLCSTDDVPGQSDDNLVAYGKTDANGECTLVLWDTSTHHPTEVDDIPFGNYYLIVNDGGFETYDEAFTVDGDEEVTITLTGGG